ncbi:MAG TPA: hypothetical protein VFW90_02630 [Candidatus Saccharimonadales bacterium]|nr:hypothetical protein [Candidatus Saccharimonadales bacterium]
MATDYENRPFQTSDQIPEDLDQRVLWLHANQLPMSPDEWHRLFEIGSREFDLSLAGEEADAA